MINMCNLEISKYWNIWSPILSCGLQNWWWCVVITVDFSLLNMLQNFLKLIKKLCFEIQNWKFAVKVIVLSLTRISLTFSLTSAPIFFFWVFINILHNCKNLSVVFQWIIPNALWFYIRLSQYQVYIITSSIISLRLLYSTQGIM